MIEKESIEQLKATLDIVDILGSYIQLRRAGQNYSACCPFHDEKTPSFMVSPTKGIYHCYGCGASGDTITFVMEYEKLEFAEAVEKLASMTGFTLSYTKGEFKKDSKFLEKIAQFYHSKLFESQEALAYVRGRGISQESMERFQLGLSGSGFESVKFADSWNARKEAIELGILGQDAQRVYARFFDRLMFPICSPSGKVVGFGGRAMGENNAKYINSPQSKVFNKSRLLYAYHLAKESIYAKKQIIVTEGYIDVVMLHQAGFRNAVATLGTALTKDHLPLLSKGEPKIIVSYDGDKAGINAAFKAAKLLAGKEGGVVIIQGGMDPADMVAMGKTQEIAKLFESPIPFIDFVLSQIIQTYDLNQPLQKEKALKECLEFMHTLSLVLQEEYKPFLSQALKLPEKLIRSKTFREAPKTIKKKIDLVELSLLKSVLECPQYLDFLLEYLDLECFKTHFQEAELLLRGEFGHSTLNGILIDDTIQALEFEDFKKQVLNVASSSVDYEKKIQEITKNPHLNPKEKIQLIQKHRDKMLKIQKGEY